MRMQRSPHLRNDLNLGRVAARFLSSGTNTSRDFTNRGGSCHVDEYSVADPADEPGHLWTQTRQVDGKGRMTGLPGKLEALPRRIDFSLVFDSFPRSGAPDDVDVLLRPAQRTIERASVPCGDRLVGDAETQKQPASREVLQRGGLNPQSDRTAPVNVINGRPHLERARPRRNSRKQNQRVRAVRFAFPERAKPGLFDQGRQFHDPCNRIVGSRIQFDVIDHNSSSVDSGQNAGYSPGLHLWGRLAQM